MGDATQVAVQLAEDIGYAVAVMEAFMSPAGTNGQQVNEAIRRLRESGIMIENFINAANSPVKEG